MTPRPPFISFIKKQEKWYGMASLSHPFKPDDSPNPPPTSPMHPRRPVSIKNPLQMNAHSSTWPILGQHPSICESADVVGVMTKIQFPNTQLGGW